MKKQIRILFLLLTFAVLSSLVIWGCAAPRPAEAPPPAEIEPIEMSFATWVPPMHSFVKKTMEPWATEVEQRTNGRLKIKIYAGASLGKAMDHYDIGVKGVADITNFTPGFTPGRFPLASVIELPFLTHRVWATNYTMWALLQKYPEIQEEFGDVKMLGFAATMPFQLYTVSKPVRTLDDIKGLVIRVPHEQAGEALKLLGGTPTLMPMTEIYQVLERGTIDGCFLAVHATEWRIHEVTKYCTMMDCTSLNSGVAMNLNSWNKLPKDIQTLLEGDLGAYYFMDHSSPQYEEETRIGLQLMKDANVETINLSPDDLARLKEITIPVRDAWVKDLEAKGYPAQNILDDAIQLEAKFLDELY